VRQQASQRRGLVLQVAEGFNLVVDAVTVAGLVIWEADSIGQERPFSPILPVVASWLEPNHKGIPGMSRAPTKDKKTQKNEEGLTEEKTRWGRR
jgi:hypothetical protein